MTWTEEVSANRIAVARVNASRPGQPAGARSRLMPAPPPQPNSGLAPIALVASVLAASVYYSKEGHKVRGRRWPPMLEPLRKFLVGSGSKGGKARSTGGASAAAGKAAAAAPVQQQQQQQKGEEQQRRDARQLAAQAAEQRLQAAAAQQQAAAAPATPGPATASPAANKSPAKSGKKKGGGKGGKKKGKR